MFIAHTYSQGLKWCVEREGGRGVRRLRHPVCPPLTVVKKAPPLTILGLTLFKVKTLKVG